MACSAPSLAVSKDSYPMAIVHKKLAPLHKMNTSDRPVGRMRAAMPKEPEPEHWRHTHTGHRSPRAVVFLTEHKGAWRSRKRRQSAPTREYAGICRERAGRRQSEQHKGGPSHLHDDIAQRECQPSFTERFGQRHRPEQSRPQGTETRIEPVRHPAGILPRQPRREPQEQNLERADPYSGDAAGRD